MKCENYQKPEGGLHMDLKLGESLYLKLGETSIRIFVTETGRTRTKLTVIAPREVGVESSRFRRERRS